MAKVFGIFAIELHPGVDAQEFIQFFNEQYAPLGARMGWKGYVLKADRGERDGKLAVIWEIQSEEQRDRYSPAQNQLSEEGRRVLEPDFTELNKTWNKLVASASNTDYIVQGK